MATPYTFPWGLHPLDDWIKQEFDRRVNDYGLNPVMSTEGMTGNYSGPRTAWTRVFSNGISKLAPNLEGFVMGGTDGFDASYGFEITSSNNRSFNQVTVGVDAYGQPHKIDAENPSFIITSEKNPDGAIIAKSDLPHRPPPTIVSVSTELSGGQNSSFNGACRKTTINWKCYSLGQLEYLTPYFLTPRITILVEWGWNHYNNVSLVDLTDTEWLYGIFEGQKDRIYDWIKASNGNYDMAMGFITDYDFKLNEAGGYDCSTTITNANYLIEGQSYQNKRSTKPDPNKASGSLQLKDLTEFVFDDMDNLEVKNANAKNVDVPVDLPPSNFMAGAGSPGIRPTKKSVRDASGDIKEKLKSKNRVFKDCKDERWLKMDLIVDIINKFFAIKFLDKDGSPLDVGISKLDITDVPVCAHPALKSTTKNIIIPNKFAPRFVTFDIKTANNTKEIKKGTLRKVQNLGSPTAGQNKQPSGEYFSLFPNVLKVIQENSFTDEYDDIVEGLISGNAIARSFPQYKDYTDNNAKNSPKAGYWGYLSDVYVNANFFKELVKKNDSVLKLVETLMQHVSEAMCNISQLKVIPSEKNNSIYTVYDVNFTPVSTKKDAKELPRITLQSASSAFMKSADFSVKLSGEMANQMIMQSASGKALPEGYGTANYDPKKMQVSKFSKGDRLFDRGVIPPEDLEKSNSSAETPKAKYKRLYTKENKDFYIQEVKRDGKWEYYIMTETNPEFIKNVIIDTADKKAIYVNSAPMPGTSFTMELLGIGGITFLSQFTLDHVPTTYNYENSVWQISQVKQKIENKSWTTTVEAQARPLSSLEE